MSESSSELSNAVPGVPTSGFSKTLVVSATPATPINGGPFTTAGLVLTGSAKAANAGGIQFVMTVNGECVGAGDVSLCAGPYSTPGSARLVGLTFKDLTSAPIAVAAGQTIDVTVTITFS
jgi:hypothetical protein